MADEDQPSSAGNLGAKAPTAHPPDTKFETAAAGSNHPEGVRDPSGTPTRGGGKKRDLGRAEFE